MPSISSIVSRGYGPWGGISDVVTKGYGIFAPVAIPGSLICGDIEVTALLSGDLGVSAALTGSVVVDECK